MEWHRTNKLESISKQIPLYTSQRQQSKFTAKLQIYRSKFTARVQIYCAKFTYPNLQFQFMDPVEWHWKTNCIVYLDKFHCTPSQQQWSKFTDPNLQCQMYGNNPNLQCKNYGFEFTVQNFWQWSKFTVQNLQIQANLQFQIYRSWGVVPNRQSWEYIWTNSIADQANRNGPNLWIKSSIY